MQSGGFLSAGALRDIFIGRHVTNPVLQVRLASAPNTALPPQLVFFPPPSNGQRPAFAGAAMRCVEELGPHQEPLEVRGNLRRRRPSSRSRRSRHPPPRPSFPHLPSRGLDAPPSNSPGSKCQTDWTACPPCAPVARPWCVAHAPCSARPLKTPPPHLHYPMPSPPPRLSRSNSPSTPRARCL